ncbi:MAG TPA: MFS transporter [Candidatus Bathyarchaeia archaeon]
MWRLGFFFHEMGFGLLSIFLPLYVVTIDPANGLFYFGVMAATALFVAIPASFLWGYLCDKTRRYKRYILLSFLSSTIIIYFFALVNDVPLLIVLYALLSVLHVAHEPPKNVLIAELYSREEWEKAFAFYEGFTEIGLLIGLLLGFFMSVYALNATSTLLLCSILNLVALVCSIVLVTDPVMIFERGLVSIEKTIDFAYSGIVIASKMMDGITPKEGLRKENPKAFGIGLILFSLASSILFTPLPIFIAEEVARPVATSSASSLVFAIYVLSACGGTAGYFLAGTRLRQMGKANVSKIVLFRSLLAFLMIGIAQMALYKVVFVTAILMSLGFAYALFLVYMLSISMEIVPKGKAGLFNALIGIGGACGSFIGPFIAQTSGFTYVFFMSGVVFFLSFICFRVFRKDKSC